MKFLKIISSKITQIGSEELIQAHGWNPIHYILYSDTDPKAPQQYNI